MDSANAAPEWQAGSLEWRSRELKEACPLEGLVRLIAYALHMQSCKLSELLLIAWCYQKVLF
jgi:hypothetical protein